MKIIEPDKETGWPSHMREDISQGQLIALRDELARLQAERRWIPVSERYPENKGYYLWANDDCVETHYFRGEWVEDKIIESYTHWMPLPQPPEIEAKS